MNVITDAKALAGLFTALTAAAKELHWAVAWATSHSEIFPVLKRHRRKIKRLVVGTHFYQTDPTFMHEFRADESVRFILKPTGVFHPKMFLFINANKTWDCIVGSANLSALAFTDNTECVVHFSSRDVNAEECKNRVIDAIDSYWPQAKALSKNDISAYEARWEFKNDQMKRVSEHFGDRHRRTGKATLEIPVLRMTWPEYVEKAKKEDNGQSIRSRLSILEQVQTLFRKHGEYRKMDYPDRMRVAGISYHNDPDFLWFGSMWGAGIFKHAIKDNSVHVSRALDWIPLSGVVTKRMYVNYVDELKRAFPKGGANVAVASRLLAMKRPDYFVCMDNKNRKKMAEAFAIAQSVDFDDYWNSIVERIKDSTWWNAPRPSTGLQRKIWLGRAAMLDSIFYERS